MHNLWLIDATERLSWEFGAITDFYLVPEL